MPWVKGQSGNPSGRHPKSPEQRAFERKCREQWELLFKILNDSLQNSKEKQWAVDTLLNRAFGTPKQVSEMDIETNESVAGLSELIARSEALKIGAVSGLPETSSGSGDKETK